MHLFRVCVLNSEPFLHASYAMAGKMYGHQLAQRAPKFRTVERLWLTDICPGHSVNGRDNLPFIYLPQAQDSLASVCLRSCFCIAAELNKLVQL